MKKTFAAEIEEDNAKLEQYRQIAAPVAASSEVSRRAAVGVGARGARRRRRPPRPRRTRPTRKTRRGNGRTVSAMGWDDEELDTQIFDKTDENAEDKTVEQSATDLFFEDDDRTVANEPPPDILEQARPPEVLDTPKPQRKPGSVKVAREDIPGPTPPPVVAPQAARRPAPADADRPAAHLPRSTTRPRWRRCRRPPRRRRAPTPAQLRRSGLNLPPVQHPGAAGAVRPPRHAPRRRRCRCRRRRR